MKPIDTKYLSWTFCFLLFSCVRRVEIPSRFAQPRLVVEGMVTTDSLAYTIKLSYSGNYTNTYQADQDSNKFFITDARVVIGDDLGDSTICLWIEDGTYQTADQNFVGVVGRTYTLTIHLSNGKTYKSTPQTITKVAPIDSVSIFYDSSYIADVRPNQYIISVHARDPAETRDFYRWNASGFIARKSWGGSCGFNWGPCGDPFSCGCHALCEQYLENDQINLLSDRLINGQELIQPVFYIPIYWFGKDFVQVKQFSISATDFMFWQEYLGQINRTGGILDPLPAPLTGNVYNPADTGDVALGLFSASDVTTKQVVIIPFNLQEYWLQSVAGEYIKPGDCQVVYPGALPDLTDPTGWDNAQVIELH